MNWNTILRFSLIQLELKKKTFLFLYAYLKNEINYLHFRVFK